MGKKNIKEALVDETDILLRDIAIAQNGRVGIIAGWPCQDASVAAGAGATGIEGSRTGLWRLVFRTIRLVRPTVAVLENVAMLLDRGVGRVFGDLASIGYDTEWHCIRAKAIGLPHGRERFFAITYSSGQRLQRHFPQEISGEQGLSWWQNIRSIEELPKRSDLYPSQLCGSGDGIAKRLHAIGNGNPPDIIKQLTRGLK